ncbi:MAG TPA: zf-HC2 domain-containing protein [Ktedonobacterales bacterium]
MTEREGHDCQIIAPYLSSFADGELAEPLHSQVARHVTSCERCVVEVSRIRAIDRMVAGLARTTPSAGVYERALAAAMQKASGQPRLLTRESLSGVRGSGVRRSLQRIFAPDLVGSSDLDGEAAAPQGVPMRLPTRARWIAAAIPAIAALLLVSLAFSLFSRVPTGRQGQASSAKPTGANPVQQARSQLATIAAQVSFAPQTPSYLPSGAGAPRVQVGPEQVDAASRFLDVTWTFASGPVQTLHLRELPSGLGFYGYTPVAPAAETLAWSLPQFAGWNQLNSSTCARCLAVGEAHSGMQLALEVNPRDASSAPTAVAWLRLVSLSIDATYQPLSMTVAGPGSALALRYQATVSDSSGVSWSWTVSLKGASSGMQTATVTGAGVNVTDVSNGGQSARLDNVSHTYEALSMQPQSLQLPQKVTQPLYSADAYLAYGELWNLGASQLHLPNGSSLGVDDLYWVDAAQPAHVYVDTATGQAVALVVSTPSTFPSSGAHGAKNYVSTTACPPYTVTYTSIIYMQPSALATSFDVAQPSGWRVGTVSPAFTCQG